MQQRKRAKKEFSDDATAGAAVGASSPAASTLSLPPPHYAKTPPTAADEAPSSVFELAVTKTNLQECARLFLEVFTQVQMRLFHRVSYKTVGLILSSTFYYLFQ